MKIGFVNVTDMRDEENLGLERLMTYMRSKETEVHFSQLLFNAEVVESEDHYYNNYNKLISDISEDINLLAFPINHINATYVYKLASIIKKEAPQFKICVGSRFATMCYKFILEDCPHIDFVVRGDGEVPLFQALEALENGKQIDNIEGIATLQNIENKIAVPNTDFTKFKHIDRDMLKHRFKFLTVYVQGTEGCLGTCTFCQANKDSKWAGRDVKDIFEEIKTCYERYGNRSFFFIDSTFDDPGELGKQRIREFCNLVLSYPVKFSFQCYFRAEMLDDNDKELLYLMKKAGFAKVFVGIESGNEQDLKLFGKRAKIEDNNRTLKLFDDCEIGVMRGFIMFHPTSNETTLADNYKFLATSREYQFMNYLKKLNIFYDSKLYHYYSKKGLLPDYHYLKPTDYNFSDKFVSQINEMIVDNIYKTQIPYFADSCFSLSNVFYTLKAIFPEEAESYRQACDLIQDNITNLAAEYFGNIFIDKNLSYGYSKIETLEKEMGNIYKEAEKLKMRFLRQKPFRSLFI